MKEIDYSIVIPVYNSTSSLAILFEGVKELMQTNNSSFEVIFVDDNSITESWENLLQIKNKYPLNTVLIKFTKNYGQNSATLCGINSALGKFIITIDDDLQINPSEIDKLIQEQKKFDSDIVYGEYKTEDRSFFTKHSSNIFKWIYDKSEQGARIGSSFRLLKSKCAEQLKEHINDHLFINQVLSWYTSNVTYVTVENNSRFEGKSGYSLLKLIMIALRLVVYYSSIPLMIMIFLCVISSILTFSLAGYYVYKHFVFGEGLGFLAIIVLSISLILASISVMGIYINRIYSSRVIKPAYAIKIKLDANH